MLVLMQALVTTPRWRQLPCPKRAGICRRLGSVDSWVSWTLCTLPVLLTRCALPLGPCVRDTRRLVMLTGWGPSGRPLSPASRALLIVCLRGDSTYQTSRVRLVLTRSVRRTPIQRLVVWRMMGLLLLAYALGLLPAFPSWGVLHLVLATGLGTEVLGGGTYPRLLGRSAATQALAAQGMVCTL